MEQRPIYFKIEVPENQQEEIYQECIKNEAYKDLIIGLMGRRSYNNLVMNHKIRERKETYQEVNDSIEQMAKAFFLQDESE